MHSFSIRDGLHFVNVGTGSMIKTDICIIGAGPVGLFAVFEAGLLKMKCHLMDALPQPGGQLSEIYPKKPIYDIPGLPSILAEDLIANLMEQIAPFKPEFTLGERAEELIVKDDRRFVVRGIDGTEIDAGAVVIAGGLGSFEPRKPAVERLEEFERKGVDYIIKDPEKYRGKRVVLAGGGDSALDWAVILADIAGELHLIHRRESFRGAIDTAEKVQNLALAGKIKLHLKSEMTALKGSDSLASIHIQSNHGASYWVETDYFIPLFGLSPKLGPIAGWGLEIEDRAIRVNTVDFSTNIPGVYAIGDVNTYPGKLKLILCGFHESALMAQGAFEYIFPEKKRSFKYTTVTGIEGL